MPTGRKAPKDWKDGDGLFADYSEYNKKMDEQPPVM